MKKERKKEPTKIMKMLNTESEKRRMKVQKKRKMQKKKEKKGVISFNIYIIIEEVSWNPSNCHGNRQLSQITYYISPPVFISLVYTS